MIDRHLHILARRDGQGATVACTTRGLSHPTGLEAQSLNLTVPSLNLNPLRLLDSTATPDVAHTAELQKGSIPPAVQKVLVDPARHRARIPALHHTQASPSVPPASPMLRGGLHHITTLKTYPLLLDPSMNHLFLLSPA